MIKYYFSLSILILISSAVHAQMPDSIPAESNILQEQLENATENNSDNVPADDYYFQLMRQYHQNPLNLNGATEDELGSLNILTPLQIDNIISYRKMMGSFINIYELQAVPTLDVETIEKILPYVTVSKNIDVINSLSQRFKGGRHSVLTRVTQTLERSKGYFKNASNATNFYPGSPQHIFFRYKYVYKNLLQYGVVGDKDAGEELFKGSQKQGFDFYSAHFFARNIGIIKSLAIGDYTVNMGQGLVQWQSLAFKKGPAVMNIKREAPVLVPYSSPGEIYFHRGVGITIEKNHWQATAFASYRQLDANFNAGDTLNPDDAYISSLQTTGYHRTASELKNKGVLHQTVIGGNIAFNKNNFHIGVNDIQYHFNLPLIKASQPYNQYALSGKSFGNSSIDYSYTYRNLHFFGEAAITNHFDQAFVNGLLISVDPAVDMSFLYRNISKSYQSLYTNAFTEATYPNNEKGFYTGISIHPNNIWQINAYADFNKAPWLKYQVNAPTTASDYMIQFNYTPNKLLSLYTRYHAETKMYDYNPNSLTLSPVIPIPLKNWRTQISYKISSSVIFRTREELCWYQNASNPETGFLTYVDVLYSPRAKKYSGNVRLQYFETDSYNCRMYAFEEDVLYGYSIPVFYGEGYRYYLNLSYDVNKHLTFWMRFAQTIYNNQTSIGSGLDQINGNKKSEITLQGMYRF